jgi:hypothetical protein
MHLSLTAPTAVAPDAVAPCAAFSRAAAPAIASASLSAAKVNPETARLRRRIDTAIAMLTAREHRAFLEAFVEPEYLAHKSVDAIIEDFAEDKADLLLSVLKEIKNKTPKYTENGTVATYKIRKRRDTHPAINFILVDGVWYLRN